MGRLLFRCLLLALSLLAQGIWPSYSQGNHTSNWAVIVSTSNYWFNYRHNSNALTLYKTVKRLGIPDSNIILMLGEDVACDPRNRFPARVFTASDHANNVYDGSVEVDYRGSEVTVESLIRVLTGRHDPATPRSKRMMSDEGSNVLIFMSGHGGNEFLKFLDTEELLAQDVADTLEQMHQKRRYNEVMLLVETCQAATLYSKVKSPNVLSMATSIKGESSYSSQPDYTIGLSLVDRFTAAGLDFFKKLGWDSSESLRDFVDVYTLGSLSSHFVYDLSNYGRKLEDVKLTEFFGSVTVVQTTKNGYPIGGQQNASAAGVDAGGLEDVQMHPAADAAGQTCGSGIAGDALGDPVSPPASSVAHGCDWLTLGGAVLLAGAVAWLSGAAH